MLNEVEDFGVAKEVSPATTRQAEVTPHDIFRLGKYILIVAASFYLVLALIRMFYAGNNCSIDGVKEVWEYSKVFLNSIVSLVLGIYFGSSRDAKTKLKKVLFIMPVTFSNYVLCLSLPFHHAYVLPFNET